MRQMDSQRERSHFARHIAISGMALALCLISLMLFRGVLSLLQALIIPTVLVLLTGRQPWTYRLAVGSALLFLTLVFFPTQSVFIATYLLMTAVLFLYLRRVQPASRLRFLLFIPYWALNGVLLFVGLVMTDFVFLTQLHGMMLRMSGNHPMRYAAILLLEAAIVSACHLTFVQFFKRRLSKAIAPVAHTHCPIKTNL